MSEQSQVAKPVELSQTGPSMKDGYGIRNTCYMVFLRFFLKDSLAAKANVIIVEKQFFSVSANPRFTTSFGQKYWAGTTKQIVYQTTWVPAPARTPLDIL